MVSGVSILNFSVLRKRFRLLRSKMDVSVEIIQETSEILIFTDIYWQFPSLSAITDL